ncbi:hypothetical protein [Paenibacillus oleatilyticus]|nr:hypothetical protein [Paenibacillus oleatilyticus]MBU7314859.1 hypothetical protein [Paenibacillus oleatilyticus]
MSEEDGQALMRQGSYRDPIGLYAAREGLPEELLFLGQQHEIYGFSV